MASVVAANYAHAIFALARDEKCMDECKVDLLEMMDVLSSDKQLQLVLKHPKINKEDKKQLLDTIFKDVNTYVRNFAKLLVDKNRFMHFEAITKMYVELYNDFNNIEVAYVQSASALNEKQVSAIKDMLAKKLNKTIDMRVRVNEELLAGVRIKIKDDILDNSALNVLQRMKDKVIKSTL